MLKSSVIWNGNSTGQISYSTGHKLSGQIGWKLTEIDAGQLGCKFIEIILHAWLNLVVLISMVLLPIQLVKFDRSYSRFDRSNPTSHKYLVKFCKFAEKHAGQFGC